MASKKPKYLSEVKAIVKKMQKNKFTESMIAKVMDGKTVEQLGKSVSSLTGMQKRYERQKEQPKLKKESQKITNKMRQSVLNRELKSDLKQLRNGKLQLPRALKRLINYELGDNWTIKDYEKLVDNRWKEIENRIAGLTGGKLVEGMEDFLYSAKRDVSYRLDIIDNTTDVVNLFVQRYGQFLDDNSSNSDIVQSIMDQLQERMYRDIGKQIKYKHMKDNVKYMRIWDLTRRDEDFNINNKKGRF